MRSCRRARKETTRQPWRFSRSETGSASSRTWQVMPLRLLGGRRRRAPRSGPPRTWFPRSTQPEDKRGSRPGFPPAARQLAVLGAVVLGAAVAGCSDRLPTAPVEGRVFYQDKPLEFGSVMFQPDVGPPATGIIGPGGTFRLSTYAEGDGAVIGKHKVRITCFEGQRPGAPAPSPHEEPSLGKSLIPRRYTVFSTSGLEREVKADNEPFVFRLHQ